ncbi:hypothetical protein ASPCAL04676 [Aspergillus calidoustus]|uniref:F-box domain-containing protein n=1 Tax=Aspergillus calidoustus TaxID=454130 RepID=A0A0U5FV80_ASPCI|nr:hypothetical protein ASPCAL04676 [Aspergillus calidoustus]
MAAVNSNMFNASIAIDRPQGASMLVLPLNLIAQIVACLDEPGDLARLCRTCRVLNYMALPQLYRNLTLTSYDKIRYRGDQPEGMGSASPFTMGLNAVITRPYAGLVRSLALRGDWREQELEEHARVGRVPDSSMMLNITVRAAVDRMQDLESFRWELSTKMLETVYLGLAQLPKLTALTIRFPSSRHPRPTTVIPAMPHLRYLKITDIDPLCYPDDISTLLWKAKKLRELLMHWSPRMRNMQEPSVMLHDYFRKCITAKQPLTIKKFGMANMYARHSEDFNIAFDISTVEEITMLNENRVDPAALNTFVDSSWPVTPTHIPRLKSMRVNVYNQRQSEFFSSFTGLERLYLVSSTSATDFINSPREPQPPTTLTPPASDHTGSGTCQDLTTPTSTDSPSNAPSLQARIREASLNSIILNHAATLRHLLLPARWPLSSTIIARLVHASPQLEQLAFAAEFSSMDTLGLLLPFLRNLQALRLLIPTGPAPVSPGADDPSTRPNKKPAPPPSKINDLGVRSLAEMVELDDEILQEKLGESLADQQVFRRLKVLGFGRKGFLLGEFYTVPVHANTTQGGVQSQTPDASRAASQDQSPQTYHDSEHETTNGISTAFPSPGSGPGPFNCNPQANSPNQLPPHSLPKRSTNGPVPPSSLGKRTREEVAIVPAQTFDECMMGGPSQHSLRRKVQRAGWDVLKRWEIWGLDSQEL